MNLAVASKLSRAELYEHLIGGKAHAFIRHTRPKDWKKNENGVLVPDYRWKAGPFMREVDLDSAIVVDEELNLNVITNVGRVQAHTQIYATTGILTNGFNYIALSNDTLTETATSTTLSTEIAANGLTRAQGTVTLPTGSGTQTTVAKTFTATGAQSAQKAALFTAVSSGVMNHALAFAAAKTLASGDTLSCTFTITLS